MARTVIPAIPLSKHLLLAVLVIVLSACTPGEGTSGDVDTRWRRFENADGSITPIPARPVRILSTSVAITGTLLAIDAPVVASASAANGEFFAQWADVAQQRGVENVWPAGSVDLEAAHAVKPDLIVVSSGGGDSALAQLSELREIAPTIVLDYGGQTWQDLATRLGDATGLEERAAARLTDFDARVAATAARITIPAGAANIVSYNGPGMSNPIAAGTGAHARLLGALGFTIEEPDAGWHSNAESSTAFVWAQYEHLTQLTAPTTFLLRVGDDRVAAFVNDPVLANLPSVRSRQVYGLGEHSFRIDYYSGLEIVDRIQARFGK